MPENRNEFPKSLLKLAMFLVALSSACSSMAQSIPAASQALQLSVFAGGTGVFTGLSGGKNLDITAGADLTFLRFRHFLPVAEIRGSYPIDGGHISSQKNFLVGPKVEYPMGRLHPYADVLFGRGAINYLSGGYIVGNLEYLSSNSFVYSPGVGLDYNLTPALALKADFQYQHWNTPPLIASGTIYPKVITLGAVYVFDFNSHHHR
jgi:hypothetical protein